MHASASESLSPSSDSLRLALRDVGQMFNAPLVDPLSASPLEVLGVSGAKFVLQQLETRRHIETETLHLVLHSDKITPILAEQIEKALRRYAEYRIQEEQALARETRRRGWRVTFAAVLLLAFFLALAQFFASEYTEGMRPLLRTTLEYGFEIVGWVMLWHPIEVLVFEPIAIKHSINALRRLVELRVVVEQGDDSSQLPVRLA